MKMITSRFVLLSLLAFCFPSLAFGATTLPDDEVRALQDIAKTLGKTDWNFNTNPCNWSATNPKERVVNNVTCNCSIPSDNFCHVDRIILRTQNLQGSLPPALNRLTYLQELDLKRNYLSGTIPKEWGSLSLVTFSVYGNRLSGPIPVELANITTLKKLDLRYNQFSGNLPPYLGNLTNLEKLSLMSNNFTGELPETLSKLTTLKDVRLSDNQFTGNIPDFIKRWTNLEKLYIQGSGFSGPIPSGISSMQNLTELGISDLNGPDSTFPPVNIATLKELILRSCNINGTLPDYLGNMKNLKLLDLSYNKLHGGIPGTFEGLTRHKNISIYLTGNNLTGAVPKWIEEANSVYIDLSYNNFSDGNQPRTTCQEKNVNLFASFSMENNIVPISCVVGGNECSKTVNSLHINCGGNNVPIGDITYEADDYEVQPASYKLGGKNWAFSNTGNFLDNNSLEHPYITNNISRLSVNDYEIDLYTNARVSPISLTYYGFCLENGDYTVKLHFAELMFTDDNTYRSLGRRLFDVHIQGNKVLKDFNIANKAQGVGKALVMPFNAYVSNNALEIRFYWAGKGTNAIPYKGVYGPLISAISIEKDSAHSISAGVIAAIVVAAAIIVILSVVGILWWKGCLGKNNSLAKELKSVDPQTGLFTLRQVKAATNNFDIANKIGEGGFGPVYKGILSNGTIIAVKQLSSKSKQGNREFINEIGMISALQHPCLVKLYGCCAEKDQLLLVYEYMQNNSLAHALFGPEESSLKLDWPTRQKICVGIARGLAFLHEESRLKIVHRDIKATNVLLDEDLNPKISDFGLAKLNEEDNTHISTRIAGTYGYMAPEYAMYGYLTDKADVYSFGIVSLEIVSGKCNTIHQPKEAVLHLLDWARLLNEKGNLMELVDQRLGSDFNEEEVMVMIKVALLCTNVTSNLRPTMSSVLSMLEGKTAVPEYVSDTSEVMDEMKMKAMRQFYHQIEENKKSEIQSQSLSIDGPCIASSSSNADLYPIHLDSSYWEKRN